MGQGVFEGWTVTLLCRALRLVEDDMVRLDRVVADFVEPLKVVVFDAAALEPAVDGCLVDAKLLGKCADGDFLFVQVLAERHAPNLHNRKLRVKQYSLRLCKLT